MGIGIPSAISGMMIWQDTFSDRNQIRLDKGLTLTADDSDCGLTLLGILVNKVLSRAVAREWKTRDVS
jgi:hypothetical protein